MVASAVQGRPPAGPRRRRARLRASARGCGPRRSCPGASAPSSPWCCFPPRRKWRGFPSSAATKTACRRAASARSRYLSAAASDRTELRGRLIYDWPVEPTVERGDRSARCMSCMTGASWPKCRSSRSKPWCPATCTNAPWTVSSNSSPRCCNDAGRRCVDDAARWYGAVGAARPFHLVRRRRGHRQEHASTTSRQTSRPEGPRCRSDPRTGRFAGG